MISILDVVLYGVCVCVCVNVSVGQLAIAVEDYGPYHHNSMK